MALPAPIYIYYSLSGMIADLRSHRSAKRSAGRRLCGVIVRVAPIAPLPNFIFLRLAFCSVDDGGEYIFI